MSSKKCSSGIKFSQVFDSMIKIGGMEKQKEFTKLLGIGPQALTKYKRTRKKQGGWKEPDIPGDWIIQWAIKTNSSIDDLLKPFLKVEKKNMGEGNREQIEKRADILIPYAWRESGETPDLEKVIMELGRIWIETYFPDNRGNLVALIMKSDNMSGPNKDSIDRNSLILIDTRKDSIDEDGIYAFTSNGHIKIRRVRERLDGLVDLVADNPAYQIGNGRTENIMPDGVSILGRVVFVGRVI